MNEIYKNGEFLRCGYTTGSCVTACAVAGARALLTGENVKEVSFVLTNGSRAMMEVVSCNISNDFAVTTVIKDGGDDPDVTTGMVIGAKVSLISKGIDISHGEGIGVATMEGLRVPVGYGAINPKPREAIISNLMEVAKEVSYGGGFGVEVFAPEGKSRAKSTYNSRLGIIGGISILGTTGIVEPMSEKALVETIKLDVDRWCMTNKETIIIAPGNYGREFGKELFGFDIDDAVKISNYLGEALDYIRFKGFKKVILVGHMGKLVKVAGGIMNTHSSYGDCRMEIMAAYGALLGVSSEAIEDILACITTDAAANILIRENLLEPVMTKIINRIIYHLEYRLGNNIVVDTVVFGKENMYFASWNMDGKSTNII